MFPLFAHLRFLLGLDAFVRQQNDGRLEDEHDRQQLDSFLDLAERVAGVEPLHSTVHLQLGHAQVHSLQTTHVAKAVTSGVFSALKTPSPLKNCESHVEFQKRLHGNYIQYIQ